MSYYILDQSNILEYLESVDKVMAYFGTNQLLVDEIGDGNLNFVFKVTSKIDSSKALIVKQAVPYLRIAGDGFPLGRERMTFEIMALQSAFGICPQHVPEIYDENTAMSLVVMQYLPEHDIMREGLIAGVMYPHFADHISTYLAQNLFKTSSFYLDSPTKRRLIGRFNSNTQLCELTENFVFTFAFMDHETNDQNSGDHQQAKKLFSDMEFKRSVLGLKYKFMNQADALLHGDLHTGSIMLNQKETFVIDPEFAFVGPMGFDLGALIGNLVMSYSSHSSLGSEPEYRSWLLRLIVDILDSFKRNFLQLWDDHGDSAMVRAGFLDDQELALYKKDFMLGVLQDTVGFAGCKMARRMFGIAGVKDIRGISDDEKRDKAIEMTLGIATTFVKRYRYIETVDDILAVIADEPGNDRRRPKK